MKEGIRKICYVVVLAAVIGVSMVQMGQQTRALAAETKGSAVTTNGTVGQVSENHTHTWDKGVVTTQATCGKDGKKTYTCTTCKKTKTKTIPATKKHTWDKGKVTKKATVHSDGVRTYTCKVCKKTKQRVIAKRVDMKTTVFTTNRILYIGDIPVYGVVKMDNQYYIPLELLHDRANFVDNMVNFWYHEDTYNVSFSAASMYLKKAAVQYCTEIPDGEIIGTAEITSDVLCMRNIGYKPVTGAICTLNGRYPMVRLDAIGAVQKGKDFYKTVGSADEQPVFEERDLVGEILPSLKKSTNRETVIAIHDYLVNTLTYDILISNPTWATQKLYDERDKKLEQAHEKYTSVNNITLASGYGVCQNYAELFREMCNRMGIPCEMVIGKSGGEGHGWNRVYLDGEWFFVDCTFDDPVSEKPMYRTKYLLVDAEKMAIDHYWSDDDYPMPKEYDPSWEELDPNNITSADMFRKCFVAQLMQRKTSFSLRTKKSGSYGGFDCAFAYDIPFRQCSTRYNSETGAYDVKVNYYNYSY